ncbi:MAG: iron ABC transporter substrate-binding protein [Rhizobiales bacterium 65-9]|nr:iron ABC transporter substrate-binding protein [Hyphomicrobiales bacterium]OJY32932.1 MAG: iron ABC transporter substrate-binding protein [Rhizobiales bacterium 65-9]
MLIDRRSAAALLASPFLARRALADDSVTDSAGRRIVPPTPAQRVFPAGPPAAIFLYTLAPDLLLGWPRAPSAYDKEFLLPEAAAKPELGRLTGRGDTVNLATLLAQKPDLIIDVGSTNRTSVDLAERVQTQTLIPYALLDGRFSGTVETYRLLGRMLGREERASTLAAWCEQGMKTIASRIDAIPEDQRPRVYYARGPRGLETGPGGSSNVETIEYLGARNVAGDTRGGLASVSVEQAVGWNPDVIVAIDPAFAADVRSDPAWAGVKAVSAGRVHLSPRAPFGWMDFPQSVNRMVGLWWLAKIFYPDKFPEDMRLITRDFYSLFYQVTPSDEQITRVLEGAG